MIDVYGKAWEANYGHIDGPAFSTWAKALGALPMERIAAGLDSLLMEGSNYPPNLVQFLRLCREANLPSDQTPKLTAPWQPIPPAWAAKLQAMMKGEFTETKQQSLDRLRELTGRDHG